MSSLTASQLIAQRLAKLKAERQAEENLLKPQTFVESQKIEESLISSLDLNKKVLNSEQSKAVSLALSGKSFCLCGSAGTGKTFTTNELISQILAQRDIFNFSFSTKYLSSNDPAILVTAFTKRATRNIAASINNPRIATINFHKLLEYSPVYYDIQDPVSGEWKKTMRFEPKYGTLNKLPQPEIILVEESSQFSIQMYELLIAAIPEPSKVQWIFIGDIQQLPPVGGASIYGEKLVKLEGVELTQVYRQALESPIIRFLTDIRDGKKMPRNDWKNYTKNPDGNSNELLRIGSFPPNKDWEAALWQALNFLKGEYQKGIYNPFTDMVLVPMNIKFGTVKLNQHIAEMLDRALNRTIHPVLVGFMKHYYAIGDHVLYDTRDYEIIRIEPNPNFNGVMPEPASNKIDREGLPLPEKDLSPDQFSNSEEKDIQIESRSDLEEFLLAHAKEGEEEKFNFSSHNIVLKSLDDPDEPDLILNKVGDLAKTQLSYAITVHKSQGLQAERVYLLFHGTHKRMASRELLYTGASRAKKYLTILTEGKILERGLSLQRIPGTCLEEKKSYFEAEMLKAQAKAQQENKVTLLEEEDSEEDL